jgi:branched-chain amino acid transport system substrate-binding protein
MRLCAAALVAALLASSCSSDADEPGTAATSSPITSTTAAARLNCAEPITVGVITDLSGGLQLLGGRTSYGVSAGFAYASGGLPDAADEQTYQIDDCEVRVILADDQSSDQWAEAAATELIEESGVDVLIGASSPSATAAVQQVAETAKVVFLAVLDTPTGITGSGFHPSTFLIAESVDQEAAAVCGDVGDTEVAALAMDYPVGQRRGAAYADVCDAAVTLLPSATDDFAEAIAMLGNADLAVLTWEGTALRSLVAAGSDLESVSLGVLPPADLVPLFLAGAAGMEGALAQPMPDASNPAVVFLRQHADRSPDALDARAMNAALLLVAALQRTGGDAGAEALVAALEGLQTEGPNGDIEIRASDHMLIQDIHVIKIVDPAELSFDLVRTVRPEPPCRLTGELAVRCAANR